jgi:hypothetical protein
MIKGYETKLIDQKSSNIISDEDHPYFLYEKIDHIFGDKIGNLIKNK